MLTSKANRERASRARRPKAPAKKTLPFVIGLTGSIGMGKSTVAKILSQWGFPIYSADDVVHDLLTKNGAAVAATARLCPQSLTRGAIDRKILARFVFAHPTQLRKLERIVHPLMRTAEAKFLKHARDTRAAAAILEIPLLFETQAEARCDATVCVTAPRSVQKRRVMARPGMTAEKFKAIQARQMSDREKCQRAQFVVQTGQGLRRTTKELRKMLKTLGIPILTDRVRET